MANKPASNSERMAAMCQTRWLFRYGLGLEAAGPDALPLTVGKAWHEILEIAWVDGYDKAMEAARLAVTRERLVVGQPAAAQLACLVPMLRRYWIQHGRWNEAHGRLSVIAQEVHMECATRAPSGYHSPLSRWGGYIDKLVQDEAGDVWILEHKTSADPVKYLAGHRDDYQPRVYAWLARQTQGIEARGVIYDICRRAGEAKIKHTQAGRIAKVRGLPGMMAHEWQSITEAMDEADQVDWYADTHGALEERDRSGYWLTREAITFGPDEIDRARDEAHTIATRLRHNHDQCRDARAHVAAGDGDPRELGRRTAAAFRALWGGFPRNSGECFKYGRLCDYHGACGNPTETTCSALRLRKQRTT